MAGAQFFLELEPPNDRLRHAPHVVIVGGGFAGIHACKALAQADVRITLIDKRNFNLFQPLLYQVSTGLVSEEISPHRSGNWWASNAMCRCCWRGDDHSSGGKTDRFQRQGQRL